MTKYLELTQGKRAAVDDADYPELSQSKWFASKCGDKWYAMRHVKIARRKYRHQYLHRFLMGEPVGKIVDHHDDDGLNCRRNNLRVCTKSQNMMNVKMRPNKHSQYKGVYWAKDKNCWRAALTVNNRKTSLGHFQNEIDAAHAYDHAARQHHGEFARLNFADQQEARLNN